MRVPARLSVFLPLLVLTLSITACTGCARQTPSTEPTTDTTLPKADESDGRITVAIAGMVTPKEGVKYYKGLAEYVGRKVGRPVRLIHKADYAQVNEMLRDRKIDIAFVCSGPYATGHDEFGVELVAAPVVNGRPAYFSYIIVAASSPATSLASLQGKVFAFADPQSNTGYIVPNFMLSQMGTTAASFFGETFYTYSHDNSIKAVAQGKADGAAVDSLIWDYEDATDDTYTSKTRVLARSEPFAIPPVVARPGIDRELFEAVQKAFLSVHEDPEGKRLLDHMRIERFEKIDDSAYDSIRDMNERIGK